VGCDGVQYVERREGVLACVLVDRRIPRGRRPVGGREEVGNGSALSARRVPDDLEHVLDDLSGRRDRIHDGVSCVEVAGAVHQVGVRRAGEPCVLRPGVVAPVVVAPRRLAHEPVELDERRLVEVDLVGELLGLHLALDAPGLVAKRLPLLAGHTGDVRRQVEGAVLLRVPERADVLEADGRLERLGHYHVVDEHPDRAVVGVDRAAAAVLDRQGAVHPGVRDISHSDDG